MSSLSSVASTGAQTISIAEKLANSQSFMVLFREGMSLVEEAATYLDGPGRQESKALARLHNLAYASESMRLTTRLMQIASWLLLQRAVNEGEMTQSEAASEHHRVQLSRPDATPVGESAECLPGTLRELSLRSLRLYERVAHLDRMLNAGADDRLRGPAPQGVEMQMRLLQNAFPDQE